MEHKILIFGIFLFFEASKCGVVEEVLKLLGHDGLPLLQGLQGPKGYDEILTNIAKLLVNTKISILSGIMKMTIIMRKKGQVLTFKRAKKVKKVKWENPVMLVNFKALKDFQD